MNAADRIIFIILGILITIGGNNLDSHGIPAWPFVAAGGLLIGYFTASLFRRQ